MGSAAAIGLRRRKLVRYWPPCPRVTAKTNARLEQETRPSAMLFRGGRRRLVPAVRLARLRIGQIHMTVYHLSVLGLWLMVTPPSYPSRHIHRRKRKKTRQTKMYFSVGRSSFVFRNSLFRNIYSHHIYRGVLNVTVFNWNKTNKQTLGCFNKLTLH